LRETAEISALNNNYFMELVKKIPGITHPYAEGHRRLEECRWSWQDLTEETGVGTDDILRRVGDFGLQHYWSSHHPWVVPEPMTIEPCETFSREDIEEYAAVLAQIADEARTNPELVKQAPHKCAIHKRSAEEELDDPAKWATTWRAYKRKQGKRDRFVARMCRVSRLSRLFHGREGRSCSRGNYGSDMTTKRLGLIVNPIAGMGGRCGLKGTDGATILARAYALGAEPESPRRAGLALSQLSALKNSIEILTVSGDMGEKEALEAVFSRPFSSAPIMRPPRAMTRGVQRARWW